jgi:N-carbamoylputrescine amidase
MSNIHEKARIIRVAAVQIESKHGLVEVNHAHATPFVEQAAQAGAQVVVLPELFASGYVPNKALWDAAEPQGGPTVNWLRKTSKRLGIYLGAGLVETDGRDFFNIFVLSAPDGEVAGRVRKANAESYCFRRGLGSHIIHTAIGKIGVGICADNHFTALPKLMQEEAIDLMLMPHAWPTPCKTGKGVSEEDIRKLQSKPKQVALLYTKLLGVPAILVNQVGTMDRMSGLLGKFMDPDVFRLEGRSHIIDSDGTIKGELESKEGMIVADVTLDPSRKCRVEPENYGGWLHPGSALVRKMIIPLDKGLGELAYTLSPLRRRKAQEIASRGAI